MYNRIGITLLLIAAIAPLCILYIPPIVDWLAQSGIQTPIDYRR